MVEVRLDQPGYSTAEAQSPVTVCATLTEANIERNLVVILSTGDDTAQGDSGVNIILFTIISCIVLSTAGAGDYVSISRPLTFTPGSGSQQRCTDIIILDDSVVENTESFIISLTTSANNADHVNFNSFETAIVSITNDDSKHQHLCYWLVLF